MFNLTAQIIFATAYNVVYYYPSKLPVLRRETGEHIYSLSAFYVANVLDGIPRSAVECFVFLAIVYPCVGFVAGIGQFAVIWLTLTVVAVPSAAYGLMLSGLFESSAATTAMAPPFDVFLCLAAGVYIRLDQLWFLHYVSPFYYANEAVMVVIWKPIGELGECWAVQWRRNWCDRCALEGCADAVSGCLTSGDEVLRSLDFGTTYATIGLDYAGLLACALAMNLIGFLGVRRMVNRTGFY